MVKLIDSAEEAMDWSCEVVSSWASMQSFGQLLSVSSVSQELSPQPNATRYVIGRGVAMTVGGRVGGLAGRGPGGSSGIPRASRMACISARSRSCFCSFLISLMLLMNEVSSQLTGRANGPSFDPPSRRLPDPTPSRLLHKVLREPAVAPGSALKICIPRNYGLE